MSTQQLAKASVGIQYDCVEKLSDDYLKAMFAQGSFTFYVFLESSLRSPRVADSNITDKNGRPSFSTQSGKSGSSKAAPTLGHLLSMICRGRGHTARGRR